MEERPAARSSCPKSCPAYSVSQSQTFPFRHDGANVCKIRGVSVYEGESEQQPDTHNEVNGHIQGSVVQSGLIRGGVHFHTHSPAPTEGPEENLPLALLRWLGVRGISAMAAGGYVGLTVDGLNLLINGHIYATNPSIGDLPGVVVLGSGLGALLAVLTRSRLLRRLRQRIHIITLTVLVSAPLAFAAAVTTQKGDHGVVLFEGGCAVGVVVYVLHRLTREAACRNREGGYL